MSKIYHNTKQKFFVFFLFISFFGFAQRSYELRVNSKVIKDSLIIDLELTNTGTTSFNIGVGQFVFGFVDTLGIGFSDGQVIRFGDFTFPNSSCYRGSNFIKNKPGKYVNFQVNKIPSSASHSCSNSELISGGETRKIAQLYFPITDCTQDIEFTSPVVGDARTNWAGDDLMKNFRYLVNFIPRKLSLNTNNGYTFDVTKNDLCGNEEIEMWVGNTQGDADLTYRFFRENTTGSSLLALQTGADTIYKDNNPLITNNDEVYVTVSNGTSCVFTSNKERIEVTAEVVAQFRHRDTCFGSPTVFTNTSTKPALATSLWSFGDLSLASVADSPTHTYADKGSYTVKLTVTNGLCSDSISKQVEIIGINKPNLGRDTSSCDGSPITIEPQRKAGYDFDWKEASQTNFSSPGNTFSVVTPGNYVVRADSIGLGCYAFDTINVQDKALAGINFPNDTSACDGTEVVFDLTVPSTANVEWRDNNSNTLFENTPTFSYAGSNGSASIKVKVIDGGCADSSVFEITKVNAITILSDPVFGQLDPNTLEFKWEKVFAANEYKVSYQVNGMSVVSGVSIGLDTTYTINGLANGGNVDTVIFMVEAIGNCGTDLSTPVEAVIGSCEVMPLLSEIDTASVTAVSASSISFRWGKVRGAVGYEVQYAVNGGVPTAFQAIGADTMYTVNGLNDKDTLIFSYKAFNNCEDRQKNSKAISFDCETDWTGADQSPYCTSSFNEVLQPLVITPFYSFIGPGVKNSGDTLFYFKAQDAGPGLHTISLVACYSIDTVSKQVQVDPAPCITTADSSSIKVPFAKPQGIYTDCVGQIYFSDDSENTIIKIDSFGVAQTILGVGRGTHGFKDGHSDTALFFQVTALVVHPTTDVIYFVDGGNHAVRKYDPSTEMVTTLSGGGNQQNTIGNVGTSGDSDSPTDADGLANEIFLVPFGIAFNESYDSLYISDQENNKIKLLALSDNSVRTIAGTGVAGIVDGDFNMATFKKVAQINFDHLLNRLYVGTTDGTFGSPYLRYLDFNIKEVATLPSGPFTPFLTDGLLSDVSHFTPVSVAPNGQGDFFILDQGFCALRIYKAETDSVLTIIGKDGCGNPDASTERFELPSAMSVFVKGFVDIVDTENDRIVRVSIDDFLNGALDNVDSSYCQFEQADTLKPVSVSGTYTLFPPNNNVLYQANGKWVFDPRDTGRYELCFNHMIGACTNNECKEVYVAPFPTVDLGSDTLMCPSQAGNYSVQTKGDTTYSFQWYENTITQSGFQIRTNDTLYHTTISEQGSYVLTSESRYGCVSSDTLLVNPSPDLTVEITSDNGNVGCDEDGAKLLSIRLSNSPGIASYLWNTGDTTATILINKAGFYKVTVQDSIGCIGDTSFIYNVHPTPIAVISTPNKVNDAVVTTLLQNSDSLISPYGMVEDSQENIFITDNVKQVIFKYNKLSKKLSVFAGELNQAGFRDGTGVGAWFNQPKGITIDSINNLYVADELNNVIRKITPAGIVTTHIGHFYTTGATHRDTLNTYARFNKPTGVTLDGTGNFVIADRGNNVIRTYNVANDEVETIGVPSNIGASVDDTFSLAKFNNPSSVFFHSTGKVFVGEDNKIRLLNILTGQVTTLDDGGVADPVSFSGNVLGTSSYGGTNVLSVVGNLNQVFYSSSTARNNIQTAGMGTFTFAGQNIAGNVDSNAVNSQFNSLQGIYIGKGLYVSDAGNHAIREIKDSNYVNICPSDTIALSANDGGTYKWTFNNGTIGTTQTVRVHQEGVYILEYTDNVTGCLGYDSIYVNAVSAPLAVIDTSLTFSSNLETLTYCFDDSVTVYAQTEENTNYRWLLDGVEVGTDTLLTLTKQNGVLILSAENIITSCMNYDTVTVQPILDTLNLGVDKLLCVGECEILDAGSGYVSYLWSDSSTSQTLEVCSGGVFDVKATTQEGCLVVDTIDVSYKLPTQLSIIPKGRAYVKKFAGRGQGTRDGRLDIASFDEPTDVLIDSKGNYYVSQIIGGPNNGLIRKIDLAGNVTTFSSKISRPQGMGIDKNDNLYVAQFEPSAIFKITPDGKVSLYAGDTTVVTGLSFKDGHSDSATFFHPFDVEIDENNVVYVADAAHSVVRKIDPRTKIVSTIGVPNPRFPGKIDGDYKTAQFIHPGALAIDRNGDLYVGSNSTGGRSVRKIDIRNRVVSTYSTSSNTVGDIKQYGSISGLAFDNEDNLYLSNNLHRVLKVDGINQEVSLFAGTPKDPALANNVVGYDTISRFFFRDRSDLTFDNEKNSLLVADNFNHQIKEVIDSSIVSICRGDSILLDVSSSSAGTFVWNTGETGGSIYGDTAGVYVVTFTDNVTGCTSTDSIEVVIQALPVITSITNDTTICIGDTISLIAETQIATDSIFWYKNSVVSSILSSDIGMDTLFGISHDKADVYYAVATNGACSDTNQVIVTPSDLNLNLIALKDTLCYGDSTQLNIEATSTKDLMSYSWDISNASGVSFPTSLDEDSLIIAPITLGDNKYIATVTDSNLCRTVDSISVFLLDSLTISFSKDTLYQCAGATPQFVKTLVSGGKAGYTYSWSSPTINGLNLIQHNDSVEVAYTGDTTLVTYITMKVTDANKCEKEDSVRVMLTSFEIEAIAQFDTLCPDTPNELNVDIIEGGVGPFSYAWSPNVSLNDSTLKSPISTIISNQKYVVTIFDSTTRCTAIDSISITVRNLNALVGTKGIDTAYVCQGDVYLLDASNSNGGVRPYDFAWTQLSGDDIGATSPTDETLEVSDGTSGSTSLYKVEVRDRVGCVDSDTIILIWNQQLVSTLQGNEYLCGSDSTGLKVITTGGTPSYTTVWSEVNTTNSIGIQTLSVTDSVNVYATSQSGQDTIIVTATDSVGCIASDSVVINISPLLLSVSIDEDTVCTETEVTAKVLVTAGVGAYAYNWEMSTYSSSDSLTKTITSSQTIGVQVFDSTTLCRAEGEIDVVVEDIMFTIKTDDDTKYHCFEDSITTITLSEVNGGNKNYTNASWTNNGNVVQTNQNNLLLTLGDGSLLDSNVVVFSIDDTKGCRGTDTVVVYRNTSIAVNIGIISEVCIGDSIELNAQASTGGTNTSYSYLWAEREGEFSDANNLSTYYKTTVAGIKSIVLRVTDNGYPVTCTNSDSLSVLVKSLPSINIEDTTYCNNVSLVVDLSDNGNVYSGAEVVTWTLNNNSLTPVDDRVTVTNQIGELKVVVMDNGCTDSTTVALDTIALPKVILTVADTVCNNDTISLRAVFTNSINSFLWSENGNGTIAEDATLNTNYLPRLDTGFVQFTITGVNTCGTTTLMDSAFVQLSPVASINISDTIILKETTLSYLSQTQGDNLKHNWSFTLFDGEQTETGEGPISIEYLDGLKLPTVYKVTDTLTGCSTELTIEITIFDNVIYYVPNAFSPNANHVENRTFKIYGENIVEEDFGITIFNRWGQEVFSSTSLKEMQQTGWDGESSLEGVYTYVLKIKLTDDEIIEKVGNITLIK